MASATADNTGSSLPEPHSLEEWFAACEAPLLRYAFRYVRNWDVSQEIVQEAFMKLHCQLSQVQQPRPWLFRTVHNLALNHCRSEHKIVPLDFEGEPTGSRVAVESPMQPDQHFERMEAIEKTRRCLEVLDQRGRELIRLKFDEGLSYHEMSQRMGLTVGHVGYILHHALRRLASELEKMGVRL